MPCHFMSCHAMSFNVMSCHAMSCHVLSCHAMSCQIMLAPTLKAPCRALKANSAGAWRLLAGCVVGRHTYRERDVKTWHNDIQTAIVSRVKYCTFWLPVLVSNGIGDIPCVMYCKVSPTSVERLREDKEHTLRSSS